MASDGCMKVTKYFLFLFNLLFFILGAVILGCGIWILADKSSFIAVLQNSSHSINVGSYILIAIGGVTMIMGFLGCIGAVNEVRCLLALYFIFLLLILIAQVAVGVFIYFQRQELKNEMSTIIDKLIVTYNPTDDVNDNAEVTWDYIQHNFKCCGWKSYQNWTNNEIVANNTDTFPCSCVQNSDVSYGFCNTTVSNLYQNGCEKKGDSWLQDHLGVILGVCVGVAVIELLGLILSMCLCRKIQNEDYNARYHAIPIIHCLPSNIGPICVYIHMYSPPTIYQSEQGVLL
ncbi:PREDICTED: CD82 antigen [Nanorana parkeri]|uniref:CD82 antigen n=1 Tax=Nanorana parkeri TaxID=125878 RepID=UPI0008540BED|nr:PREDICTED: CD82 antigen [Nanorana parkeri]